MAKSVSARRIAGVIVSAVVFVLAWSAVAYAELPFDDEYGDPTRRVGPLVGQGSKDAAGAAVGLLPFTGGPLSILLVLGGLALLGTGLLLLRHARRSRHT
jgi:hypothetical protein